MLVCCGLQKKYKFALEGGYWVLAEVSYILYVVGKVYKFI